MDTNIDKTLKESIEALPKFIKEINLISRDFDKYAKNPIYMDKIVDGLGAIICINEGDLYKNLDEKILISFRDNIRLFSKAISYYFEDIQKNIDSAIENKSKDNLENMSREELLQYIKEHNL